MIHFDSCLVLMSKTGQSSRGNVWTNLQFLDQNTLNVYNIMQFGEAASVAAGLSHGDTVSLDFILEPDTRNGGVRLNLVGIGRI